MHISKEKLCALKVPEYNKCKVFKLFQVGFKIHVAVPTLMFRQREAWPVRPWSQVWSVWRGREPERPLIKALHFVLGTQQRQTNAVLIMHNTVWN